MQMVVLAAMWLASTAGTTSEVLPASAQPSRTRQVEETRKGLKSDDLRVRVAALRRLIQLEDDPGFLAGAIADVLDERIMRADAPDLVDDLKGKPLEVLVKNQVKRLNSAEARDRKLAAHALGCVAFIHSGDLQEAAVAGLLTRMDDADTDARSYAVWALSLTVPRLKDGDLFNEAVKALLAKVRERWKLTVSPSADAAIHEVAGRLRGPLLDEVSRTLVSWLEDPDPEVRSAAGQALEGVAPSLPEAHLNDAAELLLAGLRDKDWRVRYDAAGALRPLGTRLKGALRDRVASSIAEGLRDANDWVCVRAAEALASITAGERGGQATKRLLELLGSRDTETRSAAARALSRVAIRLDGRALEGAISALTIASGNETEGWVRIDSMNGALEALTARKRQLESNRPE